MSYKIIFSNLQATRFFWRKGSPVRWYKESKNVVVSFDNHHEDKYINDLSEIVLADPCYCDNCQEYLFFQKGGFYCESCGAKHNNLSKQEVKKIVAEWTGNADPHL